MSGDKGLEKGSLGFRYLLAESIALISPMGAALGTLLGSAQYAQGAFPLAVLVAMLVTVFWINTPYQFSKKIAGAGGFYHYGAEAVGPSFGTLVGWFYLMNYFFFIAPGGIFIFGLILPTILSQFGVSSYPTWIVLPANAVYLMLIFVLTYFGIRPSLKYSLVASMLEVAFLAFFAGFVILHSINSPLVFTPTLSPTGWSGVLLGAVYGFTAVSGVSGTVYLGEEAKAPLKNVKRALAISFSITAATFVLVSYAMTVGWGINDMSSFASSGVPGIILSYKFLGLAGLGVISALVLNSVFAGGLAPLIASARLVYSMGRDRLLPEKLGRVNKHKVPGLASLVLAIAAVVISTLSVIGLGVEGGFIFMLLLAGVGSLVAHVLGSIALPLYYRRRSFNLVFHGLFPGIFLASAVLVAYSLLIPFTFPVYLGPLVAVLWGLLCWLLIRRRRTMGGWELVGRAPIREHEQAT
ncbi:APC family permease [Sulfodiicoccus acidiphilus]|nr:APC family permease [Sulfodiicoccus acidiphilus]